MELQIMSKPVDAKEHDAGNTANIFLGASREFRRSSHPEWASKKMAWASQKKPVERDGRCAAMGVFVVWDCYGIAGAASFLYMPETH